MTQKEDAHFALSSPSALLTSLRWCFGLFWGKISCHNAAEKLSQVFFPGGYSQWATLANGEICASADPKKKKKQVYVLLYVMTCHLNFMNTHTLQYACFSLPPPLTHTHMHTCCLRWRTEGGVSTARSWMTLWSITQTQEAQREGERMSLGELLSLL